MINESLNRQYNAFHNKSSSQKKIIRNDNFTYRIILKIIDRFLISPKKILDIGCGAGTLSLYYANKGNKVLGIDISEKAITSAKESAKYLNIKNATFQQMEFPQQLPKDHFDFIIFSEVIEHLENDNLALKKTFLLLKKNGIAIITTPSLNAPLHKLNQTAKFDKQVGHLRRYSLENLIKKCEKNGFEVIEAGKTEGIIRNFLFINPYAGKLVRFVKFFISDIVTTLDTISLKIWGESNIYLVLKKP